LARRDGGLDRLAELVQREPALAVADLAQRQLQLALPSEVADARLAELGRVAGGRDRAQGLGFQGSELHGGDCIGSLVHAFLLEGVAKSGGAPAPTAEE